jgi:hypothetical protein
MVKILLLMLAGAGLFVGMFFLWYSFRARSSFEAEIPTAQAATKVPIDGALGWKIGAVLPPSKDEIRNDYSITLIPYDASEKVFPMPQVLALLDRRIYEVNMTAEPDKESVVSQALSTKYGPGQFTWDEKSRDQTTIWTDGTREILLTVSTNVLSLRYFDTELVKLSYRAMEATEKTNISTLGGHL